MKIAATGLGIILVFAGVLAVRAWVVMLSTRWIFDTFDFGLALDYETSLIGVLLFTLLGITFRTKIEKSLG